jgi:hypothetical protein
MTIQSFKDYPPERFSAKPIGIFIKGTLVIVTATGLLILSEWIELAHAIEMGVTALSILLSYACLVHVYEEHGMVFHEEQRLKDHVINQIMSDFGSQANQRHVSEYLETILASKSNTQVRIKLLQHLKKDPQMITHIVNHLRVEQHQTQVLKDLGLRWD